VVIAFPLSRAFQFLGLVLVVVLVRPGDIHVVEAA
jgi:hypothetical protein